VLPAAARLRRSHDFTTTVRGGRRVARGGLVVHLVRRYGDLTAPRAGFVVSRAVGSAVTRNLVVRRLRHLLRDRLDRLPPGTDLVVRALPIAADRPYAELADDLDAALDRVLSPSGTRGP